MTDRTTRPDHWHKWPFEVDCGIPEERTALTAEEDDLRRFFMDRGWVIQMDDRPGQSVHPFADLAAALRTVIIEAKAQGRAAAHPPATVPDKGLDVGRLARAFEAVVARTPGVWVDYSGKSNVRHKLSSSRLRLMTDVAREYAALSATKAQEP